MRVLLIGAGRMGQRYAMVLHKIFGEQLELTLIDPNGIVPSHLAPKFRHFTRTEEVPQIEKFDLAIDAHPNEGRLFVFEDFCRRKVPKVILEKPHAQSVLESQKMCSLAQENFRVTSVMLPFYRHFAEIYSAQVLSQLDAGPLKNISITAGAIGLGCNGVHLIDLASLLFNSEPLSVFGQIDENAILSPRGAQFRDHGGLTIVNYPSGSLILQVTAQSNNGINTTLQFANGKIQICEQAKPFWQWWRRSTENQDLPMYRTNLEVEVTPPMAYDFNLEEIMEKGIRSFLKGDKVPGLTLGHNTLKVIALALASTRQKKLMYWTDEESIQNSTFSFT